MNTEVEVEVRLRNLRACGDAIEWARGKTWEEAWEQCPRGDWMLWLAAQVGVRRQLVVRAACAAASDAFAAYAAYYDAASAADAADAFFAASAANADAIATAKRHAALVRQIIPYRTLWRALSHE